MDQEGPNLRFSIWNMAMFQSRNSMLPQLTFKNIQQTSGAEQRYVYYMHVTYMLHTCYITVCNVLLLRNIVQLVELLSSPLTMLFSLMFSFEESVSALM